MTQKSDSAPTLIVGCGYIGLQVARRLRSEQPGQTVHTLTRSPGRAAALAAEGFSPVVADWTDRRTLARLPACPRVLVAVSYDPRSGTSREDSQVGGLANLLEVLPPTSDVCYLSTSGVYHQSDGSWVDECSPARPRGAGGQTHLRAEALLQQRWQGRRWVILRLAGIYGPGRIPRVADVLAGRPISGPSAGYLNLIHRDDAAEAVLAAWRNAQRPNRLYLIADDRPVIRRAFYEQIASLSGAPSPQFAPTAEPTLSLRSGSNKRIWNRRMHRELLPRLRYPSYVQGLADLLERVW